ncbi:hypothetical protein V8Z80_04440 [Orrella sp. JC864]|uniref:SCO family protein n=1 Tax=Orrella sp. JC864 TaxID=3120298 RepID=UPI0012BCFD9A
MTAQPAGSPRPRRSLAPLIAILLVTLAPIVGAFVVYFNPQWWPSQATNYGQLVTPQRPMPEAGALALATLDGQPFDLNSLKGEWLLVAADTAECDEACARKLFVLRNSHASQGKNVDRLRRVWFILDDGPVPQKVLDAYRGTVMVRARREQLEPFLLDGTPHAGQGLRGPMWIIDPNGNLILQYPDQADPLGFRKDVSKLVYNSRIG